MEVDDRRLLDDVGRETVLSRRGVTAGRSRREEAAVARKCRAPQEDHATHKAHHLKTDGYPANSAVNTFAISLLPATNEGPRAAHPSSQGHGFSMGYAVDGSYQQR